MTRLLALLVIAVALVALWWRNRQLRQRDEWRLPPSDPSEVSAWPNWRE